MSAPKHGDVWFRVVDHVTWDGEVRLYYNEYFVMSATPCGVWLVPSTNVIERNRVARRWVSNSATKRFAYPTRELALESYGARKKRQIQILRGQLKRAGAGLLLWEVKS